MVASDPQWVHISFAPSGSWNLGEALIWNQVLLVTLSESFVSTNQVKELDNPFMLFSLCKQQPL